MKMVPALLLVPFFPSGLVLQVSVQREVPYFCVDIRTCDNTDVV